MQEFELRKDKKEASPAIQRQKVKHSTVGDTHLLHIQESGLDFPFSECFHHKFTN